MNEMLQFTEKLYPLSDSANSKDWEQLTEGKTIRAYFCFSSVAFQYEENIFPDNSNQDIILEPLVVPCQ